MPRNPGERVHGGSSTVGRTETHAANTLHCSSSNGHGSVSCSRRCRDYRSPIRRPAGSTLNRPAGGPATRLATRTVRTQTLLVPAAALLELGIAVSSSSSSDGSRCTWPAAAAVRVGHAAVISSGRRVYELAARDGDQLLPLLLLPLTRRQSKQFLRRKNLLSRNWIKTQHTHTRAHKDRRACVDFFLLISPWLCL